VDDGRTIFLAPSCLAFPEKYRPSGDGRETVHNSTPTAPGIVARMKTTSFHPRLGDMPLWRLLVALDDAERAVGSDSPTARALARAVREKLRQEPPEPRQRKEARHVC
jgi:hypothetical protein